MIGIGLSCLRVYSALQEYRSKVHVISPGIILLDEFEQDLQDFLIQRASGVNGVFSRDPTADMYGKEICWVGVLFAVLAAASQFGSLPLVDRSLTSRVFGMEILNISEYYSLNSGQSVLHFNAFA